MHPIIHTSNHPSTHLPPYPPTGSTKHPAPSTHSTTSHSIHPPTFPSIHQSNTKTISVPSPWWAPQPGTASLLNFAFLTERLHLRFFLTLRLLCLTVLVLGALLSSFLEEALYKCSI